MLEQHIYAPSHGARTTCLRRTNHASTSELLSLFLVVLLVSVAPFYILCLALILLEVFRRQGRRWPSHNAPIVLIIPKAVALLHLQTLEVAFIKRGVQRRGVPLMLLLLVVVMLLLLLCLAVEHVASSIGRSLEGVFITQILTRLHHAPDSYKIYMHRSILGLFWCCSQRSSIIFRVIDQNVLSTPTLISGMALKPGFLFATARSPVSLPPATPSESARSADFGGKSWRWSHRLCSLSLQILVCGGGRARE